MSRFNLSGQSAIVTGSTRGIGRSIAVALAELGSQVVISSRSAADVDATVEELRARGMVAAGKVCDIGSKQDLSDLASFAMDQFGRIDTLVCNAAINPYFGPSIGIADEAWDKVMASNVKSTLWACNLVLPHMASQRSGRVIILSSIGALLGQPTLGAYSVSKAAEAQLARNLAAEWGRFGICVNTIAPGIIRTDFAEALWSNPQVADAAVARTPLGRLGEPDDIGGIAAMLATPAAGHITGQMIVVDGGFTIASGF